MLAFSNDYYGMIFRATQSVELFCAYHVSDAIFCETIKHSTLTILSNIGLIKSNKEKWEKLCEFLGEQSNETKQKK